MTPHEILKAARELIHVPQRWTKGSFAKTSTGWDAFANDASACRFCAAGAVGRVVGNQHAAETIEACRLLSSAIGYSIDMFNDTHTHAEVLVVFDRAIAATAPKGGEA